jgi:hypothetical protein
MTTEETPDQRWARYEREKHEQAEAARAELIALLQPEWRSLRVDYSGGGDQGDINGLYVSKVAYDEENVDDLDPGWVPAEESDWQVVDEGPANKHEMVDGRWTVIETEKTEAQQWGDKLHDLAWPLVSRKWGGFAFDGTVEGMIVVDSVTGVVLRRDSVSLTSYEQETETF